MSQQQDPFASSGLADDAGEEPIVPLEHRSHLSATPKSDHPATYDESLPLLSYPAQDAGWSSPATDAFDASQQTTSEGQHYSYNHYTQTTQVPWWARPQENNQGTLRAFILLILGIFFTLTCVIAIFMLPVHFGGNIGSVGLIGLVPLIAFGVFLMCVVFVIRSLRKG